MRRINAPDGSHPDGACYVPAISADGNFVAFESLATNLVSAPTTSQQIYVCNLTTGVVKRVSVSSTGATANDYCRRPCISADGRFIAFESEADNLVASGDTNDRGDVFVHDQTTGQTTLVTVNTSGVSARYGGQKPQISGDGRYVAFESTSSDLAGGSNPGMSVFVRDRVAAQTSRVSVTSAGASLKSGGSGASISADGRYVAFSSYDDTAVAADDKNSVWDVFVHDRVTKQTTLISRSSSGQIGDGQSGNTATQGAASISRDGRFVVFTSSANNLVPGMSGSHDHVYVRDRVTNETILVSIAADGFTTFGGGTMPTMAADGTTVAFVALFSDLAVVDLAAVGPVFPQYANGETSGFLNRTRIILRNSSSQPDAGQIRFQNSQGEAALVPVAGQLVSSVDYSISAWGTYELSTDGGGALQFGVVKVISNRGAFTKIQGTEAFQLLGHDVSLDSSAVRNGHLVFVSVNAAENTGVAIYNPGPTRVRIAADLLDKYGTVRSSKVLELPGWGQVSLFVDSPELFATFFQANPADFTGTLSMTAVSEEIIATVGLIQKKQSGALIAVPTSPYPRNHSIVTFPSISFPALIFPQFANGQVGDVRNRTRVILKNVSNTWGADGEIKFQDPKGNPVLVPVGGQNRSAVPYSLTYFDVLDMETDGTGHLQTGAILVTPGSGFLEGTGVFDILGNFVSVPTCPARPAHQLYASVTAQENTGIAIYNPDTSETTLSIRLLNQFGQEEALGQLTIAGRGQVAIFLDDSRLFQQFFAVQPGDFQGTINIRTTGGKLVAVLGLIQRRADGALMAVGSGENAYGQ